MIGWRWAQIPVHALNEDDIALTIYPATLLFAGVGMLLGLGVFQRIAVNVERVVDEPRAAVDKGKDRT